MQNSNVWLATGLLNDRVGNTAGENLGRIEDLAIDPDTGNIQYAILSFGGILGVGNKLFPIPWSSLTIAPSRDYVLFDVDKDLLRNAPSFERDTWPNLNDATWRRSVYDYYGRGPRPIHEVRERPVYVERRAAPPRRQGISFIGAILLVLLVVGLVWVGYLVSTRGWDEARQDIKSSLQSAAYAAKETSHDAALTSKVKTAFTLSKRIPSDKINVDSEGDVVTLRGEVPSDQVKDLAESTARDVPGVREVHNHLFVVSQSQ